VEVAPHPISPLSFGFRRLLWVFSLLLDAGKKLRHRQAQSPRHGQNRLHRQISFASRDPAHVGPMQPAMIGERFLRKALLQPELADSASEYFLEGRTSNSLKTD
jgi:hypothetical protein